MNTRRRNRLVAIVFVLGGTAVTAALVLTAIDENINLFYPPERVVGGEAPAGVTIRAGGMVEDGSVEHDDSGLGVSFVAHRLPGFRLRRALFGYPAGPV